MARKFNDVGACIPQRHYMVDVSNKLAQIMGIVEEGEYFIINRPRQFGKTTTLQLLYHEIIQRDDYLVLSISFEGLGDVAFSSEERFCRAFLNTIARMTQFSQPDISQHFYEAVSQMHSFEELSLFISQYAFEAQKRIVLLIDEVDKRSDNQLFLHFLGMLRQKYLQRNIGADYTFHSVILAGLHDVKTLKAKIRPNADQKYNSPWNIAVDFNVDLSFAPDEIVTMLQDYSQDKGISPDISALAERLYYFTSGYPYLVSKLCKFIDEDIVSSRIDKNWTVADVDAAFNMIVAGSYMTTLFDTLIKNLENNPDLYANVFDLVINGGNIAFDLQVPVINLGYVYGIFKNSPQGCQIHNRIFEQRIYSYMVNKTRTERSVPRFSLQPDYYTDTGLNVALVLQKFQLFLQEHAAHKDAHFLEREGRLLFLSYLQPILNGKGFAFKEPYVGDERRMDIVITYQQQRYVIELKIWRGPKYHQVGLQQLSEYLDTYALRQGFLLIYDFRKDKELKQEHITFADKDIFAVWV